MGRRDGLTQPGEGILARYLQALAVLDFGQHRRKSFGKARERLALDFLRPIRCGQNVVTQGEQRRWGRVAQPPSSAINGVELRVAGVTPTVGRSGARQVWLVGAGNVEVRRYFVPSAA